MPQIEDGYTRIANELIEAIIGFKFSSRQLSVIFCVIRSTYGYSKKSDALSGWQIAKMTNIDRAHISKTIQELTEMNVLIKHESGRQSHGVFVKELSLNKYYDTWITVAKSATVAKTAPLLKSVTTVALLDVQPLPNQHTHKERPKETKEDTFFYFWKAYPKKVGKDLALKTWNKKNPKIEDVLMALEWQIRSQQWKDGFIPNPATYLNEGRWQDEPMMRTSGLQL